MWGQVLIPASKTISTQELSDGEIMSLATSAGFKQSHIEATRWAFHRLADVAESGLSGARRLSREGFAQLLEALGIEKEEGYVKQYFFAFRVDESKTLSLRNLLLGFIACDDFSSNKAGDQWLRVRLELLFRFYDTDNDGRWSFEEFKTFIRHMVREKLDGRNPSEEEVQDCAKALWGTDQSKQFRGMREVVNAISQGAFRNNIYELHTSKLFRLGDLKAKLLQALPSETETVIQTPLKVFRSVDKRANQVTISEGTNTIYYDREESTANLNALSSSLRAGHVHHGKN